LEVSQLKELKVEVSVTDDDPENELEPHELELPPLRSPPNELDPPVDDPLAGL
jgi:hypothetical protein